MTIANQDNITAAFVRQFADTFDIACQQKDSRLAATIINEGNIVGSSYTINDMGTVNMAASGSRFQATQLTIPDSGTRLVTMADYDLFLAIEPRDLPKMKATLDDKYMQALLSANNRKIDDVIYQALLGSIGRKTIEGETYTATALPAGQIILDGGTTFTKAKLIKTKSLFRQNECDEQNGEELYIAYNHTMLEQILADTTLTHADYMTGRMLQEGAVMQKWMGFNWVAYETLNSPSAGVSAGVAWCKSAARWGRASVSDFSIDVRPDMKRVRQVGGIMSYGAGRSNEKKVVQINFTS